MGTKTTGGLSQVIAEVVQKVQKTCGRGCPELTDKLRPIGDLEAFDSLLGIEATRLLELRLGHKLPETVFVASDRRYALTLKAITKRVQQCLKDGGKL